MRKKILSFAVIAAMIVTVFAPAPVMAAKKSKKPTLVKSVTCYEYNDGKWEKYASNKFTYKKKYPRKLATYYTAYGTETLKFNYKFKKKKKQPTKMTYTTTGTNGSSTVKRKYNKKGFNTSETFTASDGSRWITINKYNKKGFIKYCKVAEYDQGSYVGSTITKYSVKMRKGLPKKVTLSNNEGDTGTVFFNKKGLITSYSYKKSYNTSPYTYKFKYKYKKGRVVSVTEYEKDTDGKYTATYRYTFKHTKQKISKQRYANMINSYTGYSVYPSEWY